MAVIGTGASGDPVRPPHPAARSRSCTSSSAPPPWVMPHRDRPDHALRAAAVSVVSARAAARARRSLFVSRAVRVRASCTPAPARCSSASAQAPARAGARPAAARQAQPRAIALGCKRTLVSNDTTRRSSGPNVELVTDSIAASRRGGSSPPTASNARWTRSFSAPAFTSPTCRSPNGCGDATGARWTKSGMAARRPISAPRSPAFPTCSCSSDPTRARPQLDRVHDRVPAELRDGLRRPHRPHRASAVSRFARRCRSDSTRRSSASWREACGPRAAA